jgi:hypothetical protein
MAAVYRINSSGLWPILATKYLLGILLLALSVGILIIRRYHVSIREQMRKAALSKHKQSTTTPLEGFEWENTEPLQFRPFQGKDKYNLTMGELPALDEHIRYSI